MAKITLRAYYREIETLIDQSHFEQAIAHCRHILKFFPKHVHTYRLLGKSYLESQRYGDAADVFQRILSAVPDDFVSHAGMSIIREDEGNLDAALWHMERAFEVQPSNSAIQAELRRLYGRRDGLEPPKIRLTRGALARMYLKGELFQQSINEVRAALADDPQRQDLLVLLAQAYFKNGQRVEAADVCSTLLKKSPYCWMANQILAEILSGSERAGEAPTYRQRLQALDPYAAFTSPAALTPDLVPENAIVLEKMVWSPGQVLTGPASQPEWASSLGVKMPGTEQEHDAIPEWLTNPQESRLPIYDAAEEESSADEVTLIDSSAENAFPDWMKEAGWMPSNGAPDQPKFSLAEAEEEDEIVPADIPDWLQALAPDGASGGAAVEAGDSAAEAGMAWLDEGATLPTGENLPEAKAETVEMPAEAQAGGEQPIAAPDWLKDLEPASSSAQDATLPLDQAIPAAADESSLPDWLVAGVAGGAAGAVGSKLEDSAALEDDAGFAWLESLAAKQGAEEALLLKPEERRDTPPEWVLEMSAEAGADATIEPTAQPEAVGKAELPDWLREMAPQEAEEATRVSQPEAAVEAEVRDLPDWLREMAAEPSSQIASAVSLASLEETPAAAAELPDWLKEVASEAAAQPEEAAFAVEPLAAEAEALEEAPAASAELPEWLKEIAPEAAAQPEEAAFPVEPLAVAEQPSEEAPAWLSLEEPAAALDDTQPTRVRQPEQPAQPSAEPEAEVEAAVEPEVEIPQQPAAEQPVAPEMDLDAGFAWLESLAAKQGATEALFVAPEDRSEKAPEWVLAAAEESQGEAEPPAAAQVEAEVEAEEIVLAEVEAAPAEEPPVAEALAGLAAAAALAEEPAPKGMAEQALEPMEAETSHQPPALEIETPAVLEEVPTPEEVAPEAVEEAPALPDWLAGVEEQPAAEEPAWSPPFVEAQVEQAVIEPEKAQAEEIAVTVTLAGAAEAQNELIKARNALARSAPDKAISHYNTLIKSRQYLPEVIKDLTDALYRHPVDISIWQSLGDAHMRLGQLQAALDAFTKAEELLR